MNQAQRRLCSYRVRHGIGPAPIPSLVRARSLRADGERAAFEVARPGFDATVSLPSRPRVWVLAAAPAGELAELEVADVATLRIEQPRGGSWSAALEAAAAWLARQPEARGLPIAFAGAGDAGRPAATAAAAASGATALVLDAEHRAEVALVPTLIGSDGPGIQRFLETELGLAPHGGAFNHAQRRRLARSLERGLRRERRGGLTGAVRAGVTIAASALALTLSLGAASPASAAVTADYDTPTAQLSFTSDGAADSIDVGCSLDGSGVGGDVVYTVNGGATQTFPPTSIQDSVLECPSVADITIEGGGGADTLDGGDVTTDADEYESIIGSEDVTVAGGSGGDDIVGPQGTSDASLVGGDGNDTIIAGDGDDSLFGGGLDDFLIGNAGNDTVDYSAAAGPIDADLGGTASGQGTDTLSVENAIGTAQGDTIIADVGPSSILAGGGADSVTGAPSTDTLVGEAGNDTLDGAANPDSLDGGTEDDSLAGGSGASADTLDGDAGFDVLDGASGGDSVAGGTEDDTLVSSDTANDTLNGEAGLDIADYSGGAGPVTINLNASPDTVTGSGLDTLTSMEGATGSAGADLITGGTEANTLSGSLSADTITANAGNDSVDGGLGADSVNTGGNNDTVLGGGGDDTLDAAGSAGSAESLDGGNQNDVLTANGATAGTTLIGGLGLDTLTGSGAVDSADGGDDADLLQLDSGNDTATGGGGNDTLEGAFDNDSLEGGTENDSIEASSGADSLDGQGGNDTLWGSVGTDSMSGGVGTLDHVLQFATDQELSDTLLSGEGPDTLDDGFERASLDGFGDQDASEFSGSVTLDSGTVGVRFEGAAGSDSILASDATDTVAQTVDGDQAIDGTLLTGDGTDTVPFTTRYSLAGGAGADEIDAADSGVGLGITMDGLGGNDTIVGGPGSDPITGGTGTDRVVEDRTLDTTLTDTLLSGTSSEADTLSGFEQASISGDSGFNEIDAGAFGGSVTLDGGDGSDTLTPAAGPDSIDGGAPTTDLIEQVTNAGTQVLTNTQLTGTGTDTLAGIDSASLEGGAGANELDASGFTTGLGTVTLAGEGGNDELTGVATKFELLDGGSGTDAAALTADTDHSLTNTLWGALEPGFGQTTLAGIESASLTGGAGANEMNASSYTAGPVSLDGAAGSDSLRATAVSDSLVGGADVDSLSQEVDASQTLTDSRLTGRGTDTLDSIDAVSLTGGDGNNDLDASAFSGTVTLIAQEGDDTLAGAAGSDLLNGGGETDGDRLEQASDAAAQTVTDLEATGDGTDNLANGSFEEASLSGGAAPNEIDASGFTGPTTIRGDRGEDTLEGGTTANDRLVEIADEDMGLTDTALTLGTDGPDSLVGGFDSASLTGGAGANELSATGYTAGDATLAGDAGNDTLAGGGGDDSLAGGAGVNAADYSANANGVNASLATNTVQNASTDSLSGIQELIGSPFGDTLTGDGGANTLRGGAGGDTITGGGGSDSLSGEADADSLNSDDGGTADTNNCGSETDTLAADFADVNDASCEDKTITQPPPGPPPPDPAPDPGTGGGTGGGGTGGGGTGGGGGGGGGADTLAPLLDVGGDEKQHNKKKVKVEVACDEDCTVDGEGTIKVPEKYKDGKVKKKEKFDLKGADEVELEADETAKLKLEFKNKAADLVEKAMKKKEKSTAKVTATALDAAGNETVAEKFEIKVKK